MTVTLLNGATDAEDNLYEAIINFVDERYDEMLDNETKYGAMKLTGTKVANDFILSDLEYICYRALEELKHNYRINC